MAEQDDGEKSHEPTQKRLDDARTKGQIARSPDLVAAVAFGGFLLAFASMGAGAVATSAAALSAYLARPDAAPFAVAAAAIRPLALLLVLPAVPVLVFLVAQRGLVFTLSNLAPRLSRIDPVAAAGRRFGPEGLAEFAKGAVKMGVIGLVLVWFLSGQGAAIIGSATLPSGPGTVMMIDLLVRFLGLCTVVAVVLGVADFLWQIRLHHVRNRMSRQDLVDEHKEVEGDPHARAARRQRGQEIAMNRMLADVPKADVVIVNPTHYAVALQWKPASGRAPVCLAKGKDEVAARIRAIAAENGVPVHSDPPTARAIHASVEIGSSIRPEHYRPVAAALRLTEALRQRKKRTLK